MTARQIPTVPSGHHQAHFMRGYIPSVCPLYLKIQPSLSFTALLEDTQKSPFPLLLQAHPMPAWTSAHLQNPAIHPGPPHEALQETPADPQAKPSPHHVLLSLRISVHLTPTPKPFALLLGSSC